jgi:hypothetical protein
VTRKKAKVDVNILPGHEDLKRREVLNLKAVVNVGDSTKEYKVFVGPGGALMAEPEKPAPIDQLEVKGKTPVQQRWALVDQMQANDRSK